MKGFNVAEEGHVVSIIPPIDINGGATVSDYWNVKNASHCSIILTFGVTGATAVVTLEESDDNAGNSTTAIGFSYYIEETAAGDTLATRTAVTSSGFTYSANNGIIYVIEVDASELTDGFPYLVLKIADPSSATLASAVAINSGIRHAKDGTVTAIT